MRGSRTNALRGLDQDAEQDLRDIAYYIGVERQSPQVPTGAPDTASRCALFHHDHGGRDEGDACIGGHRPLLQLENPELMVIESLTERYYNG